MTQARRWLDDPKALPTELQQALAADCAEPGAEQLAHLTDQLARSLGVALIPPPPVSGIETVAAAKAGAAIATSAAKPLVVLGAWVLGGVVLGAGLSGVAQLALPADSPAPQARAGSVPPTQGERQRHRDADDEAAGAAERGVPDARPPAVSRPDLSNARSGAAVVAAEPITAVETEVELLKRAQLALGTNPGLALALTRTHEARFERAELDQEREMIAIDALRRLGRSEEARRRGEAFRARYPHSAHLHRLEGLLAR